MKNVKTINEWTTVEGKLNEVEVVFADGSSVTYYGIENRKGSIGKEVTRIDEFTNMNGQLNEVEIKFANGMKVVYKGEMNRKGNL